MIHQRLASTNSVSEGFFKLNPLTAAVRIIITGGLLVGANLSNADPGHLEVPVPTHILPITDPSAGVHLPDLQPDLKIAPHEIIPLSDQATHGSALAEIKETLNHTNLIINQKTDKAIIDWDSFNVGKDASVIFNQNNSASIALNNIHQADASQIMGSITANGQVYLFNQNGFIFGKDSVVDTSSLVVTALNISDDAFKNGIIRVFDKNSSLDIKSRAALNGKTADSNTSVKSDAKIQIDNGAKLHASSNGSILIAAPTVDNSGKITTDKQGQVILVASQDAVYLQPTSSKDPFAGLLVEVGSGGQVNNNASGELAVRDGNVTLAGFAVNQSGRISATTSVDVNGSVRLLARENAQGIYDRGVNYLIATNTTRNTELTDGLKKESNVIMGKDSRITISPDSEGGAAIDEQAQNKSVVEVVSDSITMESGATITAHSGQVQMLATDNIQIPLTGKTGQINFEKGSIIDVSGIKDVSIAMERNVQDVSVQSFNLRDAPYQRGGILKGETVKVDIRNLPTIVDASSAGAGIKKSIEERLTTGGTINLTASGNVSVKEGAITDISGGSIKYRDGYINTTKLITADTGRVVDISVANPNIQYTAIANKVTEDHKKWGVSESFDFLKQANSGKFEASYTDGKQAGAINVQSPMTAWAGQLKAAAITGLNQRDTPVQGGSFILNNQDDNDAFTRIGAFLSTQNILFSDDKNNLSNDSVLSTAFVNNSGLSNLTLKTGGSISLGTGINLSMPVKSQLNFDASKVAIDGSIYTAGGTIALKATNTGKIDTGNLTLQKHAKLDVSGRWINDTLNNLTTNTFESIAINAGKIKLSSDRDLNIENGSQLHADGGVYLFANNLQPTAGKAGDLILSAGTSSYKGVFTYAGKMSAYGLLQGGSLSITANKINLGKQDVSGALNLKLSDGNLDITKDTGIKSLTLATNQKDISIQSDVNWEFTSENKQLIPTYRNVVSSNSILPISQDIKLPENISSPLGLTVRGITGVNIADGSQIKLDQLSSVDIISSNVGKGIYAGGSISVPAGKINLLLSADNSEARENNTQAIWLGKTGVLDVQGSLKLNPTNFMNRTTGSVLNGGDISIVANRGYVLLEQGSRINVSGTSTKLDLPVINSTVNFKSENIGSNAGSIKLSAAEGIVLDGEMSAKGGLSTNSGGSLLVSLDRNNRNEPQDSAFTVNTLHFDIENKKSGLALLEGLSFGSDLKLLSSNNVETGLSGVAKISSDQISKSGFYNLSLSIPYQYDHQTQIARPAGEVRFVSNVDLNVPASITLDAQTLTSNDTVSKVVLNTAYLHLGSSSIGTLVTINSLLGNSNLETNSKWTDIQGALLLSNFKNVNFNSQHDTRFIGVKRLDSDRSFVGDLSTIADINFNSSQVYPTTLTDYKVDVRGINSILSFTGKNTDVTPLSAAGKLTLNAQSIEQNGVLKAPLGNIYFNAINKLSFGSGSYTSVSANNLTIPFGRIVNDTWQYPLTSPNNLVFNESPENLTLGEKHIELNSPDISFNKGSVVDLSGNGDLMTATFTPGLGGSTDYLLPVKGVASNLQSFAILPSLGSSIAPYDPMLSASSNYNSRTEIYLNATSNLPAGFYTILPSRYALLSGGYLVTPVANTQDQAINTTTDAGIPVVPGYLYDSGSNVSDNRYSGFMIETNSDVKKHAEYSIQSANDFFTQQANNKHLTVPILPVDSGQISINASTRLVLEGRFNVLAPKGKGAKMDISAKNIKIVNNLDDSTDALEVLANDINNLKVDSLLLGGTRVFDNVSGETKFTTSADNIIFEDHTKIDVLDLVAVAQNNVEIKNDAIINASGTVNTGDEKISIKGDGAFIRFSADKQITLNRTESFGNHGSLLIDQGATIGASKSMILDATQSTVLNGDIKMKSGSLFLSANSINLGEVGALGGTALNLSNETLSKLSVDDLILKSKTDINFYGNVGIVQNNELSALTFKHLVLDTSALVGINNSGLSTKLHANTLDLTNSNSTSITQSTSGNGSIDLIANQFNVNGGTIGFNGFSIVNMGNDEKDVNTVQQFLATNDSIIKAAANVNLIAGTITASGGHSLLLDTTSGNGFDVTVSGITQKAESISNDFGGKLSIMANAIKLNDTKILLPSGSLELTAINNDILIAGSSDINLAGKAVDFGDSIQYTKGGNFIANALKGHIQIAETSKLNVEKLNNRASGGSITFKAPLQDILLLGQIKANGASANIDVSKFNNDQSFSQLSGDLKNARVTESIYLRTRNDNISLSTSDNLSANKLTLVADNGFIDVSGGLKADNTDGGFIGLYAGKNITLEDHALLSASGSNNGGQVLLSSVDSLNNNASGIEIKSGAIIDVHGKSDSTGGKITLNAARTADGINIKPILGSLIGESELIAQGVRKYDSNHVIKQDGSIDIENINQQTLDYMNVASNKVSLLASGLQLRPGIEIDYQGDMNINTPWDFASLRYGTNQSVPGSLLISATGKLNINSSITDGYNGNILQTDESWNFQLVSGADQGSADKTAILESTSITSNDLVIGSGVSIHSGSGDITIATSGNLIFSDQTSTIYNAGRAQTDNRYGTLDNKHQGTGVLDGSGTLLVNITGEYPILGGNINIVAGKNIDGALSNQFLNPWLQRQGSAYNIDTIFNFLTAWSVDASLFQQNIGSFGGGNVSVNANGNINDLSVMLPTTGKQLGTDYANSNIDVQGGGNLHVFANGNINGGAYFVAKGGAELNANGGIKGSEKIIESNAFVSGPEIIMGGDSSDMGKGDVLFSLNANKGVNVAGVSDAMVLNHNGTQFFTYTNGSQLNINSFAGDVHLNSDISIISNILGIDTSSNSKEKYLTHVYPASVKTIAYNGSIILDSDIILFPSAISKVELLAREAITSNTGQYSLTMSDADTTLLPTAVNPIGDNSSPLEVTTGDIFDTFAISKNTNVSPSIHANTPVHFSDKNYSKVITKQGDISSIQLNLPMQSIIQAGQDLLNAPIQIQQNNSNNSSLISAGRDILFERDLDRNGNATIKNNSYKIEIAGPGQALIKTGRNLDLGSSVGLTTVGNLYNPNLSSSGSSLDVIVGLNEGTPNYSAFINKYLLDDPLYQLQGKALTQIIVDFMRQKTGNNSLTDKEALQEFSKLAVDQTLEIQPQLNPIIYNVFFNDLILAGSASAADKTKGNKSGFEAIDTLFPDNKWKGDMNLFFSKLQSISGGDINLFVPGGEVNAGVAVVSDGAKSADQLGIVAQSKGDINAFVKNDFIVNTSRVFTLGGGDILIWSSDGNIDAGKGAKTALAVKIDPPFFDSDNKLVIPAPKITSGSGIRTAASPGIAAGDVFLFAPRGVVDAGEAGIGGTNVTISATAVLGANNISIGGVGTGVPQASAGSIAAGLTGTSNMTANVSQAAESAAKQEDDKKKKKDNMLGMLSVDILGFGD